MAPFSVSHRATGALLLVLLIGSILGSPAVALQQPRTDTTDITHLRARKLFVQGMTQAYLEDYDEAVVHFEKALDLSPETPAILMALAEAEIERDNVTSALYYARQARDRATGTSYYHRKLAELLQQAGRQKEAIATYRGLLDAFPDHRQARLALARLQAKFEKPEAALRTYETLINSSKRPPQAQVYAEMLDLYRQVGNPDGQERVLKVLIDLRENELRYRRLLGRLYLEQERYAEALPHFEILLQEAPTSPQLLSRMKTLYERTNQPEKASTLWQKFKPKNVSPDQLVTRARSLYNSASPSDDSPDSNTVRTAIDLLQKVLSKDSSQVDALDLLGTIRYEAGAYVEAARLLDRATESDPRAPKRWEKAASAHLNANHHQRAASVAEEGLLLFPGRPNLLYTLAFARLGQHENAAARTRFQAALDKADGNFSKQKRAALHAGLGLTQDRIGNHKQADRAYETALDLDANQPRALRYYARSLAQRKTRLDYALTLAQRAVDNAPSDPEALATLGWVQFQRGSIAKAKSIFERALNSGTVSATVYERAGDLYQALDDDTRARRYWQEALDRAPNRDSLQKKLDALPQS